jgi:hypothetical protein
MFCVRRRQSGRFSNPSTEKRRVRVETKEIAMSKTTKLMGTACILASALGAGPAAAASLMGFTAMVDTHFGRTTFSDSGSDSNDQNAWSLGGSIAMPIDELAGINWQIDAQYTHGWNGTDNTFDTDGNCLVCDARSAETWDFGFSPFWAGENGRFGINVNYSTETHWGHLTNGGAFGEWYFGNITAHLKGGWLSSGGTPFGGHGNYYGGAITGYVLPNLAITGSVTWSDLVTGATLESTPFPSCSAQTCGRRDWNQLNYGAQVEFLVSESLPISVYGGFNYTQFTISEGIPTGTADDFNAYTWMIGVRFYPGSGALINKHRDGNLFGWLRGPN